MSLQEKLISMLKANDPAVIKQLIHLLEALVGSEEIKTVIAPLLYGIKGLKFGKGLNQYSNLEPNHPLREALVYSLLKASGKWAKKKTFHLKEFNQELDQLGFYSDLGHLKSLVLSEELLSAFDDNNEVSFDSVERLTIDSFGPSDKVQWLDNYPKLSLIRHYGFSDQAFLELVNNPHYFDRIEYLYRDRLSHYLLIQKAKDLLTTQNLNSNLFMRAIELGGKCLRTLNFEVGEIEFQMNFIPAGKFLEPEDQGKFPVNYPFLMSQTQVSQPLWTMVMGKNPSAYKGEYLPVEHVSFFDCLKFCNTLSHYHNLEPVYTLGPGIDPVVAIDFSRTGYRMPNEAEWEYAAKANTKFKYAGSNDPYNVAWYSSEASWSTLGYTHQSQPLAMKQPNSWGLYDMSGNVWEWCNNLWDDSKESEIPLGYPRWGNAKPRTCRGGAWNLPAISSQIDKRLAHSADWTSSSIGFRVMRAL